MEEKISFISAGHKLTGLLHKPDGSDENHKHVAFLVLHGFGTSKDSQTTKIVANYFAELGYLALRFDFRGCGESGGEPGRIICLEQVEDVQNAISYLGTRSDVDSENIAVMGHSFGA